MTEKEKPQTEPTPPKEIEDGIGIRLKAARELKGLSQSDLHNKTGLSRTVLINYEAGRHKPGARELRLICDALEISPNYLIYGSEEPHRRGSGLVDTLLGASALSKANASMLVPMCFAILGKDDSRALLSIIESMLKAKDPEGYAMIMELTEVFDGFSQLAPEEKTKVTTDLKDNPAATEAFEKGLLERLKQAANPKQG